MRIGPGVVGCVNVKAGTDTSTSKVLTAIQGPEVCINNRNMASGGRLVPRDTDIDWFIHGPRPHHGANPGCI